MPGALTLLTYGLVPMRRDCPRCGRKGSYPLRRLEENFGPEAPLPDVLGKLSDCQRRGNASDSCRARFADLAGFSKV